MKKIFKFFIVISAIFCLTPIFSAMAQEVSEDAPATGFRSILATDGVQGESLRICLDTGCCHLCDLMTVGSNIFKFLRNTIAFPVVILMIIYGGVMMIFSGGSPQRVNNGKKAMSSALIGFAIVWGVSLILNSVLMIIAKSPIDFKSFINGDISSMSCTKDCGSGDSSTGSDGTGEGGVTEVKPCITSAISDLGQHFNKYSLTVTSTTGGIHKTGSYHYKGLAADIQVGARRDFSVNGKSFWESVVSYLKSKGFHAFCDNNGDVVSCSEATHIHFDTKGMPNNSCP
ncbi:MAG TPA: pilin [Candidatus Paceibacterota bacterium]|nr:pilin [Candidatus Paceibacterota bacterium]HPT40590.1 pilin [Candidatus Paceibacterota bacterium]